MKQREAWIDEAREFVDNWTQTSDEPITYEDVLMETKWGWGEDTNYDGTPEEYAKELWEFIQEESESRTGNIQFGLYTVPSSSLIFRKMDGKWEALHGKLFSSPQSAWEYYSSAKGKPVNEEYISTHKGLECLTYCRPVAKTLYGVPDSVELYKEDARGIQSDAKQAYTGPDEEKGHRKKRKAR